MPECDIHRGPKEILNKINSTTEGGFFPVALISSPILAYLDMPYDLKKAGDPFEVKINPENAFA